MMQNQRIIIQNWHSVEESYDHGKMTLSFVDHPSIIIDNANEQKYLTCYVNGARLCYTHIESFVTDFSHLLSNVQHINVDDCDGQRKRKRSLMSKGGKRQRDM
jgi:hypothetical protein